MPDLIEVALQDVLNDPNSSEAEKSKARQHLAKIQSYIVSPPRPEPVPPAGSVEIPQELREMVSVPEQAEAEQKYLERVYPSQPQPPSPPGPGPISSMLELYKKYSTPLPGEITLPETVVSLPRALPYAGGVAKPQPPIPSDLQWGPEDLYPPSGVAYPHRLNEALMAGRIDQATHDTLMQKFNKWTKSEFGMVAQIHDVHNRINELQAMGKEGEAQIAAMGLQQESASLGHALLGLKENEKQRQFEMAQYAESFNKEMISLRSAAEEIRNTKIDPWGGTGSRVMMAIGMALGAAGATLAKTPNYAMEIAKMNIDANIAKQTAELDAKKVSFGQRINLLDHMRGFVSTMDQAKAATRAYLLDQMRLEVEAIRRTSASETARLNADQFLKLMDEERELADKELELKTTLAAKEITQQRQAAESWRLRQQAMSEMSNQGILPHLLVKSKEGLEWNERYSKVLGGYMRGMASAVEVDEKLIALSTMRRDLQELEKLWDEGAYKLANPIGENATKARRLWTDIKNNYRISKKGGASDKAWEEQVSNIIEDPTGPVDALSAWMAGGKEQYQHLGRVLLREADATIRQHPVIPGVAPVPDPQNPGKFKIFLMTPGQTAVGYQTERALGAAGQTPGHALPAQAEESIQTKTVEQVLKEAENQ